MRIPYFVAGILLILHPFLTQAQTAFTLQEALHAAAAHNPTLLSEKYNVDLAQTEIINARLRPNPVLNNQTLQLMDNKYYKADSRWFNPNNRQVWWQLTKTIQLPNQRRFKIDVAEENYRVNENLFKETKRSLFLDVASAWITVWADEMSLSIISIAQANLDTLVNINRLRFKNQVISKTDVVRTELLANQYDLQFKVAERELVNSRAMFRLLLGTTDSATTNTADSLTFSKPISLDSLMRFAQSQRADINAARGIVTTFEKNIRLQRSLAWPQPEMGGIWNPQNTVPYVGLFGTVKLPLFDHNQGMIQRSIISQQQAEQSLANVIKQSNTEIITAYNSFKTYSDNLNQFHNIIQQSESILSNVRYAYLRGGTTIVDFLEAQRSWLETQQQYFSALEAYRKSYVQLLYVTGLINQLAE